MITRRSFIGSALLALPAVRALASIAPIRAAQYSIGIDGFPLVDITTYTNCRVSATWDGLPMEIKQVERGTQLQCYNSARHAFCELRLSRVQQQSIDIDYIQMWTRKDAVNNSITWNPEILVPSSLGLTPFEPSSVSLSLASARRSAGRHRRTPSCPVQPPSARPVLASR